MEAVNVPETVGTAVQMNLMQVECGMALAEGRECVWLTDQMWLAW